MTKVENSKTKRPPSKRRGIELKRGKVAAAAAPPKKSKKEASGGGQEVWSKSKKKRMRMLLAKQKRNGISPEKGSDAKTTQNWPGPHPHAQLERIAVDNKTQRGSSLQQAFKARLSGSRFRLLNEELYTNTSSFSFERFQKDPTLFEEYHQGFRHQVESWPVNPVDLIVSNLRSVATSAAASSDRKMVNKIVVADFGCGDAQLAQQLLQIRSQDDKCPLFQVHSFDLVATSDLVTACDMAKVPLGNGVVDVAIFCLSLMGTNLADFLREAHRVLKKTGKLKIAEVRSRFETPLKDGKKDELLKEFINVLDQLGFQCTKTDRSNKMFVLLDLEKTGKKPRKDLEFTAKPCFYKRR